MIDTQVKTKSVTNTQLAVAVGVAVLAGGLAFAAAPRANNAVNACTVQTITFGDVCGRDKVRGASYVCSDGSSGRVTGSNCRTLTKIQQIVDRTCARLSCEGVAVVPPEQVAPVEAPIVPVPNNAGEPVVAESQPDLVIGDVNFDTKNQEVRIAVKNNGTAPSSQLLEGDEGVIVEWSDMQGAKVRTGVYRIEALAVGEEYGYMIPYPGSDVALKSISIEVDGKSRIAESNENNNRGMFDLPAVVAEQVPGEPKLFIVGKDLYFSQNGGKASIRVMLSNRGTASADSTAKYRLLILDTNREALASYDLNLSSDLAVGDTKDFGVIIPIPANAVLAEVIIDPPYTDGHQSMIINDIPAEFLPS